MSENPNPPAGELFAAADAGALLHCHEADGSRGSGGHEMEDGRCAPTNQADPNRATMSGEDAGNQLIISFQGDDYMFGNVSPEKVHALLLLFGGQEMDTRLESLPPSSMHNKGKGIPHRIASLMRFKEKRITRNFEKKIRYRVRKDVALRMHNGIRVGSHHLLQNMKIPVLVPPLLMLLKLVVQGTAKNYQQLNVITVESVRGQPQRCVVDLMDLKHCAMHADLRGQIRGQ